MVHDYFDDDRHFVNCDLKGLRWRDTEWFCSDNIRVRAPREDPGSAVVILGPPDSFDLSAVENIQGWILNISLATGGESVDQLHVLLSRFGIEPSFVLVLAHAAEWRLANSLRKRVPNSFVIYLNDVSFSHAGSHTNERLRLEREMKDIVRYVQSNPILETNTLFLEQDGTHSSWQSFRSVSVPSHLVRSGVAGGYRRLISLLSGAVSTLRGQGDPALYFRSLFTHRGFPPSEEWLVNAASDPGIVRSSGVRLSLESGGLRMYGFDVRQTRLAHSWSARRHEFRVWHGQTPVLSERLGTLRREILDSLPVHVDFITNSYGAFSFRNAEPLSLEDLGPGTYVLELVDEFGDDLLASCHRTFGAMEVRSFGKSYELVEQHRRIALLVD